jgi:hypothetical protein
MDLYVGSLTLCFYICKKGRVNTKCLKGQINGLKRTLDTKGLTNVSRNMNVNMSVEVKIIREYNMEMCVNVSNSNI